MLPFELDGMNKNTIARTARLLRKAEEALLKSQRAISEIPLLDTDCDTYEAASAISYAADELNKLRGGYMEESK